VAHTVLFKPMAVVQSYVAVNMSQQWSNASVEQLAIQTALDTPYSFIDFISFVAMGNPVRFPLCGQI
jgi:hypothetical protein